MMGRVKYHINRKIFFILFSIFLAVGISGIVGKQYPSIDAYYSLDNENSEAYLMVEGDIKAPRKKVWNVLTTTDTTKICTHTEDVLKFTITKTGENTYEAYYVFDYPWPFSDRWQKLEIIHDRSNFKIYWKRIDGTIERNTGYYKLDEHDIYTTLNYKVVFDPGIKYVPESLVNYVVKIQAPRVIKNIRRCVDKLSE